MKNTFKNSIFPVLLLLVFDSCSSVPKGAEVISDFNLDKYLGKWYEIARMDFRFERNLNNVTATYSMNEDGTIKVDNRGYNYVTKEWKHALGKAKPVGETDVAMLKVSFFGPFYSPYTILAIDDNYRYAMVTGKNLKYLWILSREKTMPEDIKQKYIEIAKNIGFDVSALVWTIQDK